MVAEIYSGYVTGHTNAKDTLGDGHHARTRIVATTAGHYYGDWVKATGGKGDWSFRHGDGARGSPGAHDP
ncbi:hypothetical protein [Streptomyces mesophilus]|uniref:hypothetical protein n=1 Tax=Streptomyces mesophilus TaxID=1775132 RepID=UPI003327B16A